MIGIHLMRYTAHSLLIFLKKLYRFTMPKGARMSSNKSYAIIKTGGKQYRVAKDDIIQVEMLDAEPGEKVEFAEVLFVGEENSSHVSAQALEGFKVMGELLDIVAGPKVVSLKYKPSHNNYRKFGHRQHYARVKITEIAKA
ncbi:50S ribosomal protein L21 [Neochlamydia sp. AcF65]|nr:50S ribosomal protein L21 [Neochlamydia sp. AcF65]NGY94753.1 50S ribosomal protein L21 [Neochlamydia sp. AcF84]